MRGEGRGVRVRVSVRVGVALAVKHVAGPLPCRAVPVGVAGIDKRQTGELPLPRHLARVRVRVRAAVRVRGC